MREIRDFANRIAREYRPERIILFGSYANGSPTEDSDVDLLIVFRGTRSAVAKSLAIRSRMHPGFPIDLLTRSTVEIAQRLRMRDWFMHDISTKGKVLYDARRP